MVTYLSFLYERVRTQGELGAKDLVDECAGLCQPGIDDLPQHVPIPAIAVHEAVTLQHGKVL
jgi:hypothetical protein